MTPTAEDDEPDLAAGHASGAGYDLGRLYAFSDGVFAIAITILVLGIPVPSVADPTQLPGELRHLSLNLVGFALSFVLVGTQWIAHHRLLRRLDFCTGTIMWINLLVLMGICLVPFATSLLVRYGGTAAGAIPYAILQASIGIMFVLYRLYLVRHGVDLGGTLVLSWIPALAFVLSIPLALVNVNYSYAVWVAGLTISRAVSRGLGTSLLGRLRRLDLPWTRSPS
ncbi:MAG TPA: TMEM175 family protein [Terriglobales bacterium]|nr:TMEM175 family protein [Terriglobales bacterium]